MKCTECKEEIEISKSMADENPPCPKCDGKLEVLFRPENSTTFIRHGTGWGARGK